MGRLSFVCFCPSSKSVNWLEKGEPPRQETRGFSETKGATVNQRTKEEAHDYRYFPEPDIPPLQFTKGQIEKWRSELPELPAQTRYKLEALGISKSVAVIVVSAPSRLQKFTELNKLHNNPKVIADLVVNTPEDKIATLEFIEKKLVTDEGKIKLAATKVIAANPKVVTDIKGGKQQAMFFLIGQIKRELGDIDVPLTQKVISDLIE